MYSALVAIGDNILASSYNNLRKDRLHTGSILPFAGGTIPEGWLLCNGQEMNRNIYSDLFSLIGIVYGAGDGAATFNLPDIKDCMPIGVSTSHANNSTGGGTITLTTANLPTHSHVVNTAPDHTHKQIGYAISIPGGVTRVVLFDYADLSGIQSSVSEHNHAGATQLEGGGLAFTFQAPYMAGNYIIKYY